MKSFEADVPLERITDEPTSDLERVTDNEPGGVEIEATQEAPQAEEAPEVMQERAPDASAEAAKDEKLAAMREELSGEVSPEKKREVEAQIAAIKAGGYDLVARYAHTLAAIPYNEKLLADNLAMGTDEEIKVQLAEKEKRYNSLGFKIGTWWKKNVRRSSPAPSAAEDNSILRLKQDLEDRVSLPQKIQKLRKELAVDSTAVAAIPEIQQYRKEYPKGYDWQAPDLYLVVKGNEIQNLEMEIASQAPQESVSA